MRSSNLALLFQAISECSFALQPFTLPSGRKVAKAIAYEMRGRQAVEIGTSLIDEPFDVFVMKVVALAEHLNRQRPGVISIKVHGDSAYVYERPLATDRQSAVA